MEDTPSTPAGPPPILHIDLTGWPQVSCQVPATVPIGLAIAGLETVLAQLRQIYIESEIARRSVREG